jgi:hypothetical protein
VGQSGWWWVTGNLVRDVAALSKMELLPGDMWAGMPGPGDPITDELAAACDQLAAITAVPGTAADSRARYESGQFRVPAHVYNYVRQAPEPVLGEGEGGGAMTPDQARLPAYGIPADGGTT